MTVLCRYRCPGVFMSAIKKVVILFIALIVFFTDAVAFCSPTSIRTEVDRQKGHVEISTDNVTGPTVTLRYNKRPGNGNAIDTFAYFVPVISPTLVKTLSSEDNLQQVKIISHIDKSSGDSFRLFCEFEMLGSGWHKSMFDPAAMIDWNMDRANDGKPIKNLLDHIKFEGKGFGRMEIKGTRTNNKTIVTEIEVKFDDRGKNSPVTIGLYNVKKVGGKYSYDNRFDEITARINSLKFCRTKGTPKMEIKLDSISDSGKTAGWFGTLKGALANLFIKPIEIDKTGHETMLKFGQALFNKAETFTFPKAVNLIN